MKEVSLGESSWGEGLSSSAFFTGGDRPKTHVKPKKHTHTNTGGHTLFNGANTNKAGTFYCYLLALKRQLTATVNFFTASSCSCFKDKYFVGFLVHRKQFTSCPYSLFCYLLPCHQSSSWNCWQERKVSGNTPLLDCQLLPPWSQTCDAYSCRHIHIQTHRHLGFLRPLQSVFLRS